MPICKLGMRPSLSRYAGQHEGISATGTVTPAHAANCGATPRWDPWLMSFSPNRIVASAGFPLLLSMLRRSGQDASTQSCKATKVG